jgi:ABC-type sugar transport system substrate-binding protein
MSQREANDGPWADDRPWQQTVSRSAFLKLGAAVAGGVAFGGSAASSSAAVSRHLATTAAAKAPTLAKYSIGISIPVNVQAVTLFTQYMGEEAAHKGNGEHITSPDANGSAVLQHEQVETMIEKDTNAILLFLITIGGWEVDVKTATSKGIGVWNHSASPVGGCTQNVALDQYAAGYGVGEVAAQWMNRTQGGKGEWAQLPITNDPQLMLRGEGQQAAMKKYAPGATLVGSVFAQLETEGATAAANLLSAHPNLKMILCAGDDPGLGAFSSAVAAGKSSPSDFFIGSCDGNSENIDKIAAGTIYQADSNFLFPFSAVAVAKDMEAYFRHQYVYPTRIIKSLTVTHANASYNSNLNPFSAKDAALYASQFKYSKIALKTGQNPLDAFPGSS